MKRKFKGITIPYLYYDKDSNYTFYIYKNKEYTDLNKLFTNFVGFYLTYHFMLSDQEYEVHNLSEVLDYLLKNPDTFSIPKKYKKEYSLDEYNYIIELQDRILNKLLKIDDKENYQSKFSLKNIQNPKLYHFTKTIQDKYKNIIVPKKIRSDIYHHYYYVVAGNAYQDIYHALNEVYSNSLYYQFGGTKNENNRTHLHSHSFEDLIKLIFSSSTRFKIHVFQQKYYSEQELKFLTILADKLKELNFTSIERDYKYLDPEEYFYLKDNKKFISLLIYNLKYNKYEKEYQKAVLESHKI